MDDHSLAPGLKPGASVRYWRPGVAEHGMKAVLLSIDEHGLAHLAGGAWSYGPHTFAGPTDARRVVTEEEYRARWARSPDRELWNP